MYLIASFSFCYYMKTMISHLQGIDSGLSVYTMKDLLILYVDAYIQWF